MTTSSERRLHPLSILFSAGPPVARFSLPLLLLALAAESKLDLLYVIALYLSPVLALFVIAGVVRWLRFTYHYEERDLVVRSGLLTRNERRIPYARIQNLDASQNPLQRLTGVVAVFVQTGGGEEPEASMRVLPLAALDEMRERVIAAGGRAGKTAEDAARDVPAHGHEQATAPAVHDDDIPVGTTIPQTRSASAPSTLLNLGPRELILAGFIENRGMVVIAGALALLEQAGLMEQIVQRVVESDSAILAATVGRWTAGTDLPLVRGAMLTIMAVLMILLFIRLLSTVWAVVRLYDFRLERAGDELHTTYGLFTRVSATIPLRRVQTVIVHDKVLHRVFGRCSVRVETAGGTMGTTGAPVREPIAPILPMERLPELIAIFHPDLSLADVEWQPVHPGAFGRILRGSLIWPVLLAGAAWFVVGLWTLAFLPPLLVFAAVRARLRARHLAWSLTDDAILARDGAFMRTVRVARFNRVQAAAVSQNPLDLRMRMARVRADTAGARGGVVIPFLGHDEAERIHGHLAARTAATAFTW